MKQTKKLIEVALPLVAINKACVREKAIRQGHPSTLHLWWVIFAQMVDDPSAHPDLFPTEKKQEKERQRLFQIIEDLVQWENTTNEGVLERARAEIWQSWRAACAENVDHPRARELFNRHKLPGFHDPFAGGGSIPLEAQRFGLEAVASDLNPVAVMICKAMIEIPPKFAGRPPVNPIWQEKPKEEKVANSWRAAQGLADDVRYYGRHMRDEAEKRIGHLYPKIEITAEMAEERPDLKPLLGQKLTVIAWLWARTVKSPNPAFAEVKVPLASSFMLSTKENREVYVQPLIERGEYRFTVRMGKPKDEAAAQSGTKLARANFACLMSGAPISTDYIKDQGKTGQMGVRLMAIVAEGERGRVYLAPTREQEKVAQEAKPIWRPEGEIATRMTGGNCTPYGLTTWGDLFTDRQIVALKTLADMVQEAREWAKHDALVAGLPDDGKSLQDGGTGATAYADAIALYMGLAVSRTTNTINSLVVWSQSREQSVNLFSRQAIPMAWDFPEVNPFGGAAGDFGATTASVGKTISAAIDRQAHVFQADAQTQDLSASKVVSTDPPYYDNVGYADLSDFFYVWLRCSLKPVFPDLFNTLAVPKAEELVANQHRQGSKEKAEAFFLNGMTQAMRRLAQQSHPAFPVTIYYAYKQAESDPDGGATASTGWDTFLEAVIRAGFAISGTWPMRTERDQGVKTGKNVLASSIVIVCRPRPTDAPTATRRDFLAALKTELPAALSHLQRGNIAPVDLQQAVFGPGMATYTRYGKVLDAEGKVLSVREALALINQTLDEVLAAQEGDFDADTRWALVWFDQSGFSTGDYGVAEQLSKSKNTSVQGLVKAGVLTSKGGKVRLLKPSELPEDWDPTTDERLTVWEMVHHLIRVVEAGGEGAAADLAAKMGSKAEVVRELAYRLYTMSNNKKRATEALSYNSLVQSWPEITRLAREGSKQAKGQTTMFGEK
jgi:putative DNA methylase